jgi:GNAT superfamily N-acetyltransferase
MEIRKITALNQLKSQDASILSEHFLKNFSPDEFEKCLSPHHQESVILGLFESNILVSFLLLIQYNPREDAIVPQGKVWLERVFTKEAYRSRGYASQLIQHAEWLAKHDMHQTELWLDTVQARHLYEHKLGYAYQFSLPWEDTTTRFYSKKL